MTDSELRKLIQASPDTGHRALYDQYINYVYSIVYHTLISCGSHEDVEECVADTFAEVIFRIEDIREDSLKAYIGTTARHKALNAMRTLNLQKKQNVSMESIEELPSEQTVEVSTEYAELRRLLLQKITALGEPDSSILIQKYYYNRKSGEIAKIVGLTPAAVRKRCSRAVKRLKQELSEFHLNW